MYASGSARERSRRACNDDPRMTVATMMMMRIGDEVDDKFKCKSSICAAFSAIVLMLMTATITKRELQSGAFCLRFFFLFFFAKSQTDTSGARAADEDEPPTPSGSSW